MEGAGKHTVSTRRRRWRAWENTWWTWRRTTTWRTCHRWKARENKTPDTRLSLREQHKQLKNGHQQTTWNTSLNFCMICSASEFCGTWPLFALITSFVKACRRQTLWNSFNKEVTLQRSTWSYFKNRRSYGCLKTLPKSCISIFTFMVIKEIYRSIFNLNFRTLVQVENSSFSLSMLQRPKFISNLLISPSLPFWNLNESFIVKRKNQASQANLNYSHLLYTSLNASLIICRNRIGWQENLQKYTSKVNSHRLSPSLESLHNCILIAGH